MLALSGEAPPGRDIAVLEVSVLLHQYLAPETFKNILHTHLRCIKAA